VEKARNLRWGGSVIGQDKVNKARQGTARTFSANPFGFSHGQRTVREVSRGTYQPATSIQPNSTSQQGSRAVFRQLGTQVLWLVTGAILIALMAAATRVDALVLVTTDSSCPIGIYRLVNKPLARGELVEACLPSKIASYGMARGYLNSGDCPNGAEPVIKVVGAMAGDHVDLSLENIRVNGTTLPQSATRLHDSRGREVRTLRPGAYETEADQVWLFGFHDPRSWDSRYFGPVPVNAVLGAVEPVFPLASFARAK
jgi:conjugative transfer signal peptidase TraF